MSASARPLSAWPTWALAVYDWCARANGVWPYVYGGGHNNSFLPSQGLTDGRYGKGYDCSAVVSAALHAAHILGHPSGPYGTHELEQDWGVDGHGSWLTVWVANRIIHGIPVEHCVLEFPHADANHRFFMAFHTTGPHCKFEATFDTTGYTPKRRAV